MTHILKTKGACGKAETPVAGGLDAVSHAFCLLRDKSYEGQSTWADGKVYTDGKLTHRISYNGKVWKLASGELEFNPYA